MLKIFDCFLSKKFQFIEYRKVFRNSFCIQNYGLQLKQTNWIKLLFLVPYLHFHQIISKYIIHTMINSENKRGFSTLL
jgi:hypothetical protein